MLLVNSNPATIMTDPGMADATYIEPINWRVLERIIANREWLRDHTVVRNLICNPKLPLPKVIKLIDHLPIDALLRLTKTGRVRTCRANPVALGPARRWLSAQSAAWEARVAASPRRFRQASEQ